MAWTVPVITGMSAAPAVAASLEPGLQGWIQWQRSCSDGVATLRLDGSGGGATYPATEFGFYVFNTTASTTLTDACVYFQYDPGYCATVNWVAQAGSGANWSAPTVVSYSATVPPGNNFVTTAPIYRICYSGTWTYNAASGGNPSYSITTQVPKYVGTADQNTCVPAQGCRGGRTIRITRVVTVGGTTIAFNRQITV